MYKEQEGSGSDERMKGDYLVAFGGIHILKEAVTEGKTPLGNEFKKYIALCGQTAYSWAVPSMSFAGAKFINSLSEGAEFLAIQCSSCFDRSGRQV